MKHVLIVDDEKPFLLSVCDGLTGYSDKYQVHLAYNGIEALESLRSRQIDLVVTDLKMPLMDGFQLLIAMNKEFPQLPVIVMTAFGTPDIETRLKEAAPFHYLEKPLDLNALSDAIDQGLESSGRSLIRGITLATFLQLIQLEKKTCTLKVKTSQGEGFLFLQQGELIDAETQNLRGEEAVYQIVCWSDPEIEMETFCRRKEKVIQSSIEHMLLEAFRLEDERKQDMVESEVLSPTLESTLSDPLEAEESFASLASPPLKKPTLGSYLNQVEEVKTFAIFDDQGFLLEQHPEAGELAKLATTIYLSTAWQIGTQLGQELAYLEFRDMENQRCILCLTGKTTVALLLNPGCHPPTLRAQLISFDSQSTV